MNKWTEIPKKYDLEADHPIHCSEVLLGWFDWKGNWCCEVGPYSTNTRIGQTSSVSYHGQATHFMYLPMPPLVDNPTPCKP